jgi:hypothetical protein
MHNKDNKDMIFDMTIVANNNELQIEESVKLNPILNKSKTRNKASIQPQRDNRLKL